jgi:hypothetical protein
MSEAIAQLIVIGLTRRLASGAPVTRGDGRMGLLHWILRSAPVAAKLYGGRP